MCVADEKEKHPHTDACTHKRTHKRTSNRARVVTAIEREIREPKTRTRRNEEFANQRYARSSAERHGEHDDRKRKSWKGSQNKKTCKQIKDTHECAEAVAARWHTIKHGKTPIRRSRGGGKGEGITEHGQEGETLQWCHIGRGTKREVRAASKTINLREIRPIPFCPWRLPIDASAGELDVRSKSRLIN